MRRWTGRSTAALRAVLGGALATLALVACTPREVRANGPGDTGLSGLVTDETRGALPGVTVALRAAGATQGTETTTDAAGNYRFEALAPGTYAVTFLLINFAQATRTVVVTPGAPAILNVTLYPSLHSDVTVTGKRSFTNLADAENPAENLVGIAQSASQGAVTAEQLEARPVMRAGEVLETVPGVIISQHSGEGKANQYYLRGFNLDHGTDFATTVAGVPVNMPTHAHGHGYSDLGFLIPELVSRVQYSKGPYFADQGDFSTAGSATINYTNTLDRPLVRVSAGGDGWRRALVAASPRVDGGNLLFAVELNHNDGPWERGDDYEKLNAVLGYSRGDRLSGLALTAMAYAADWNSTDQVPQRAIDAGLIGRFGTLDSTDGGTTHRYSLAADWQRASASSVTRVSGYFVKYDLKLFSNFTYALDDPERGDQFEQLDDRAVSGAKASYRHLGTLFGRRVEQTLGGQLRYDDIGTVGLYRTQARRRLGTVREDDVRQASGGAYYENEIEWGRRLRTLVGLRGDVYRFDVESDTPANSGVDTAGLVSPKAGVIIGPWGGTEVYANAGFGFHSNDARGATITVDPATGEPAGRVTPLARAKGAEIGLRTVALRHVQSTLAVWTLSLASELLFVGDAGTTEASRPSHRTGIEWANYLRPFPWLTLDADLAVSRARFTDDDPAGDRIPGSVQTVVSAGASVEGRGPLFGSLRWRYFGPRPLVEDDSVESRATSLVNLQVGCRVSRRLRVALDVFNLLDASDSDIDYFYTSRLAGEPAGGVDDVHLHPTPPRTARLSVAVEF